MTRGLTTFSLTHLPSCKASWSVRDYFPPWVISWCMSILSAHIFTRFRWIPGWGMWVGDAEHGHLLLPCGHSIQGHQSPLSISTANSPTSSPSFPEEKGHPWQRVKRASQSPKVSKKDGPRGAVACTPEHTFLREFEGRNREQVNKTWWVGLKLK